MAREKPFATGVTPRCSLALGGLTRLFTLAMVLRDIDRGALSLDTAIVDMLPDGAVSGLRMTHENDHSNTITIAHLLAHRSGITDYFTPAGARSRRTPLSQITTSDRGWNLQHALGIAWHYPGAHSAACSSSLRQLWSRWRDCFRCPRHREVSPRVLARPVFQPIVVRQNALIYLRWPRPRTWFGVAIQPSSSGRPHLMGLASHSGAGAGINPDTLTIGFVATNQLGDPHQGFSDLSTIVHKSSR